MNKKICLFLCLFFFLGVFAGCSSSMNEPISISISPQTAFVGSGQMMQFTATGDSTGVTWSVNGTVGGSSTVGTIDTQGNYTAPTVAQNSSATVTATSKRDPTKSKSANVSVIAPGTVTSTNNPQVALYTITPPADANVSIQFGTDMTYGLTSWTQPTPAGGGTVSIFVAGMKANTTYHMRAVIQFGGNAQVSDSDHTFTTGSMPESSLLNIATTTPGMKPQSGVELLDLIAASQGEFGVTVTDLAGNVLWGWDPGAGLFANGVQFLPNGHFLMIFGAAGATDGAGSIIQEVDLGGNVVFQITAAQLNQALAAATCPGCNISVVGNHHDLAVLPNGHWILIAGQQQVVSGTTITGDVLIDLDQNHNPVWVWSEFDHLDVTRQPFGTDWTHTNSVVYSPDDGALIVSMRNQSWVIKVDYGNGKGTGNILWKLGYQGDFTLMNGTDPVDWFYAQHDAHVESMNSSGNFHLSVFDNGDNRVLDTMGTICATVTPCVSRVPFMQIDETAKTATIQWADDLAPIFSFFGGNARLLSNGNVEFDECSPTFPAPNAAIYEVTMTTPPQTIWQMKITGQFAYRGYRLPSLYPGVQW